MRLNKSQSSKEELRMTRKDYKLIAGNLAVILQATNSKNSEVVKTLVLDLCKDLKTDNPRFDETKFLMAVGLW
jgi:hypothetical protein